MKRLIIFLLFTYSLFAQATLYTPNGKSFQSFDANRGTYNKAWYNSYRNLNFGPGNSYPNSWLVGEWEDGLWEYNCHIFAWNNWQGAERWDSENDIWKLGKPSPYNLYWINYPDVFYTDNNNPTGIVSYVETSNPSEAALVTYIKYNDITHSARLVGNGTRYISKWGSTPIVNHPPTEVPISYGSRYKYYKINPKYRPVGNGDLVNRNWQTISNALNGIPTNGSLVHVLSGTHFLSNNVTVPSGVSLRIKSGATINLNGYHIKAINTLSLSTDDDVTIAGMEAIVLRRDYNTGIVAPTGYYSSLESALSNAINGEGVELVSNNATIESDITLPSGVFLSIKSGKTLTFTNNSKLIVNGKLYVEGNANSKVTFTKGSSDPMWGGIEFNNGSSGNIKYANINYAEKGIYGNSVCPSIENCKFENNTYGIFLKNVGSKLLKSNVIKNNYVGLYCNNADPTLRNCKIENNTDGIILSTNSTPIFYYNTIQNNTDNGVSIYSNSNPSFGEISVSTSLREIKPGYNRITSNNEHGIYLNGANAFMGFTAALPQGGLNSIFNNSQKQLYAENNSIVEAGHNYWATNTPLNVIYQSSNSNVIWQLPLSSDPGGGSSLSKKSIEERNINQEEFNLENVDKNNVAEVYNLAMYKKYSGKEDEAIKILKDIVSRFPNSNYVFKVMSELFNISKTSKQIDIANYCASSISKKDVSKKVKVASKEIEAIRLLRENKKELTVSILKDILKIEVEEESEKRALFNLFLLGMDGDIKSIDKKVYLNILKEKYPNEEVTLQAMILNGEKYAKQKKDRQNTTEQINSAAKDKKITLTAYPNPFNPVTKISYTIPKTSYVKLEIYNSLGEKVETLVNETKEAGSYTAHFNGANFASGVYIYRLQTNGKTISKKMILMK